METAWFPSPCTPPLNRHAHCICCSQVTTLLTNNARLRSSPAQCLALLAFFSFSFLLCDLFARFDGILACSFRSQCLFHSLPWVTQFTYSFTSLVTSLNHDMPFTLSLHSLASHINFAHSLHSFPSLILFTRVLLTHFTVQAFHTLHSFSPLIHHTDSLHSFAPRICGMAIIQVTHSLHFMHFIHVFVLTSWIFCMLMFFSLTSHVHDMNMAQLLRWLFLFSRIRICVCFSIEYEGEHIKNWAYNSKLLTSFKRFPYDQVGAWA